MDIVTNDGRARSSLRIGFALALVSAASFGLAGALAKGLIDVGWTAGAAVLVRLWLSLIVVVPLGLRALDGRYHLLRRNARLIVVYGVMAVAAAQYCFFSAVARMDVGVALMLEYTAPVAVVAWLWLRHGSRPSPTTLFGAAVAAGGLVLVLDLLSGAEVDPLGVLWGLGAMLGLATYFVVNSQPDTGLPAVTLAAGGILVGSLLLTALAIAGVVDVAANTAPVDFSGTAVPWWVPVVGLGIISAAVAYTTGVAAGRLLGSRLASFIGLLEVVAAVAFAWLLLAQVPSAAQWAGGALILIGVVGVRLGEQEAPPAPGVAPSDARASLGGHDVEPRLHP